MSRYFFVISSICLAATFSFGESKLRVVSHTPYDRQMGRINSVLASNTRRGHSGVLSSSAPQQWMSELRAVPYQRSLRWKKPSEINMAEGADCKDKAVALFARMRQNGVRNVRVVIGKRSIDDVRTHAWVEWETAGGAYVLDPTFDESPQKKQDLYATTYIPLYAYDGTHKYQAENAGPITAVGRVPAANAASGRYVSAGAGSTISSSQPASLAASQVFASQPLGPTIAKLAATSAGNRYGVANTGTTVSTSQRAAVGARPTSAAKPVSLTAPAQNRTTSFVQARSAGAPTVAKVTSSPANRGYASPSRGPALSYSQPVSAGPTQASAVKSVRPMSVAQNQGANFQQQRSSVTQSRAVNGSANSLTAKAAPGPVNRSYTQASPVAKPVYQTNATQNQRTNLPQVRSPVAQSRMVTTSVAPTVGKVAPTSANRNYAAPRKGPAVSYSQRANVAPNPAIAPQPAKPMVATRYAAASKTSALSAPQRTAIASNPAFAAKPMTSPITNRYAQATKGPALSRSQPANVVAPAQAFAVKPVYTTNTTQNRQSAFLQARSPVTRSAPAKTPAQRNSGPIRKTSGSRAGKTARHHSRHHHSKQNG
jgi:hypothetical protein